MLSQYGTWIVRSAAVTVRLSFDKITGLYYIIRLFRNRQVDVLIPRILPLENRLRIHSWDSGEFSLATAEIRVILYHPVCLQLIHLLAMVLLCGE